MDVYRSNYMESYRDRITTGGDEKIDTDSYIKGTTYDYSKWFKFGDFLAKTIYRPYFSSVERKVDREPVEDRFEKKEDKEEPMQDHITQPVEELKDPSTEEPEKKAEMEKEEADTKDDAMALEDQRLEKKMPLIRKRILFLKIQHRKIPGIQIQMIALKNRISITRTSTLENKTSGIHQKKGSSR